MPYGIRETYLNMFRSLCDTESPVCVLLTDGKFGSAFFEHRYLSELLGIPLVEGSDLYVGHDGRVYARTIDRDIPVDLIYRRVEDLDIFVPGLRDTYLDGKVALVNGLGTGAADDKLVFMWVPDMIERYLGESPILEQAPSYNLQDAESLRYVLENLDRLVIKARQGYGGLGVFVMPDLGMTYKSRVAQTILENPHVFVAQETLDFSQHMVFNDANGNLEPRYIDLRVFAVQDGNGRVTVFPGGLTRVALAGGRRVRVIEHHTSLIVATAGQVSLETEPPDPEDVYLEDIGGLTEGFEYTVRSPLVNPESVSALAMHVAGATDSLLGRMRAVASWVYEYIRYKRGTTDVSTTAEQVVSAMEGVCQDKTHLALGMLRALGIPCRYVSGLLAGQTGETHSWMEVLHPNEGWLGLDPTRGITLPPARDYVKLAVGRDYTDVSPINGSFLSKGGTAGCAAAASVRFEESEPVLDDALRLLEGAYVVKSNEW